MLQVLECRAAANLRASGGAVNEQR